MRKRNKHWHTVVDHHVLYSCIPLDVSPFDPRRKYIQVCVQNVSDASFQLAELSLSEKQQVSLELQSLNTKAQQVAIMNSLAFGLLQSDVVCGCFISFSFTFKITQRHNSL